MRVTAPRSTSPFARPSRSCHLPRAHGTLRPLRLRGGLLAPSPGFMQSFMRSFMQRFERRFMSGSSSFSQRLATTVTSGRRRMRVMAAQLVGLPVLLIGLQCGAVSALAAAPAGTMSAVSAAAVVMPALACACFDGSELRIDHTKSMSPSDCPCPYAVDVRRDLASALAQVPADERGDKARLALAVEQHFLTQSPDYERMLRYDAKQYAWFLQNVRCTCEGCKATVYFSNCQLSCTPAVIYKRRARIWLAMGFSTDALITYYLNEYNATHSAREQIEREWLLPKRQKRRGWMVPALLILGAIAGLGVLLGRTVRRSRARQAIRDVAATKNRDATGESGDMDDAGMSHKDRNRVLDALDDMEQDGGW